MLLNPRHVLTISILLMLRLLGLGGIQYFESSSIPKQEESISTNWLLPKNGSMLL